MLPHRVASLAGNIRSPQSITDQNSQRTTHGVSPHKGLICFIISSHIVVSSLFSSSCKAYSDSMALWHLKNMNTHACIHTRTYTHACIHTRTYLHACIHTRTYTHACIHTRTYTHMRAKTRGQHTTETCTQDTEGPEVCNGLLYILHNGGLKLRKSLC